MSLVGLQTSSSLYAVGNNMKRAQTSLVASTGRLSSGNRLTRAADDVAAMSVATKLDTRISALRQSRLNLAQADSMLQLMDNGLAEIDSILNRMNAVSVQASSGVLTSKERGFLDQEYQHLSQEIDRLSQTTNFNDINVLNSQSTSNMTVADLDDSEGNTYSAVLRFDGNWTGNNRYISLGSRSTSAGTNGDDRFYWRNNTNAGNPQYNIQNAPTIGEKIQNLVEFWNDPDGIAMTDERFSQVRMVQTDYNEVTLIARSKGDLAGMFMVNDYNSQTDVRNALTVIGGDVITRSGATALGRFNYQLGNREDGSDTGLSMGSTIVTGATSGMLDAQAMTKGEIRLSMTNSSNIANNRRIQIDNGLNGVITYTFRTNATNNRTQIQIGATLEDTLDNAVVFFNELYANEEAFFETGGNFNVTRTIQQLEFSREGTDLVIRSRLNGTQTDMQNFNINFRENIANADLESGGVVGANVNMADALDSGVNTDGVINKDFVGTLSGFEATYESKNRVNLSLKVGDVTYSGIIQNTDLAITDRVRMFSDDNGYFDLDLKGGKGLEVNSQADATLYARSMDSAFMGLRFYQERVMTNYHPASADLTGSQFSITSDDFSKGFQVQNITVESFETHGFNTAKLSMTVNGERYESQMEIDRFIGRYSSVEMVNVLDGNKKITFTNGSAKDFDMRTDEGAAELQDLLERSLPIDNSAESTAEIVQFQVGQSSARVIDFSLVNASYDALFDSEATNVLSKESAQYATEKVQEAIDRVTSLRADVGAKQQRVVYASSSVENAIMTQDEARGVLEDTNIADESTNIALETVRLNAGVSLMAQANNLRTNLMNDVFDPLAQISGA